MENKTTYTDKELQEMTEEQFDTICEQGYFDIVKEEFATAEEVHLFQVEQDRIDALNSPEPFWKK